MSSDFRIYNDIRKKTKGHESVLSNLDGLGLDENTRALYILWMYPDVLNVFGGRGDLMALMRVSTAMGVPVRMRRLDHLSDEIPLDWADLIYYASGDLTCMEDILRVTMPRKDEIKAFAQKGKMIVAVSSSGVLLADRFIRKDGTSVESTGLLGMTMTEREKVHGDDLWIRTESGMEITGNQIQLLDVSLSEGQEPLGTVIYGRGNDGSGMEGARTGNVIYTGCVGPALVRNPWFAADLIRKAADACGVSPAGGEFLLPDEAIEQELLSAEEARAFIRQKM